MTGTFVTPACPECGRIAALAHTTDCPRSPADPRCDAPVRDSSGDERACTRRRGHHGAHVWTFAR
jgi:hypothetical protein